MWVPWFLEVKLSAGLGLLGAWKGAETYGTNQEDSKLRAGLLLATARTIGGSDSALPRACALTKEDGYMDNKLVVCGGAGSRARAGRQRGLAQQRPSLWCRVAQPTVCAQQLSSPLASGFCVCTIMDAYLTS